ncbi:MAG: FAD-dependent oxidoreductase [Streptococcaceae bacterium]|jgi:pyruvate/2-oxoglutarate dehydrogenase complex dihydrolipoamide dehydrogenase (E3) component|nr:FAD-dependent oxidoreductase [Streptococcaceae bacterium]
MSEKHIQNLIIGFGKAGRALAQQLSRHGEEVLIVERDQAMYGGTCPNVGCLPSKSLILSGLAGRSWEEAINRRRAERELLRKGATGMALNEPLASAITATASFIDAKHVQVGEDVYTADKIFINTGATPVIPDIKGVEYAITSEEALDADTLAKEFVIIGSGYVGLEFAGMYNSFGAHVTVLETYDSFLPREDEDVASEILKDMKGLGIEFRFGVQVSEITEEGVIVNGELLKADKVLIATGRKPNIDDLNLAAAGIEVERGAIKVNDDLKTTAENVWAMGDVRGGGQFYYLSTDDFRIIADQFWGTQGYTRKLSDRVNVPYAVFINPTLARVGLDEKQAKAAGVNYRLFKMAVAPIVKTKIIEDTRGLMKALVDPKTDEILGATLYAPEAHENINLLSLAMKMHTPYKVFRDQIFTHPTFVEGLNDLFAAGNEVK